MAQTGISTFLVKQCTNTVAPLSNGFIRLTDSRSGNYHFVALAQSKHITSVQSYFSIPVLKAGVSRVDELTYMMKRETSGFQQHELNNFLVGAADVTVMRYFIRNALKLSKSLPRAKFFFSSFMNSCSFTGISMSEFNTISTFSLNFAGWAVSRNTPVSSGFNL